MKRLPNLPIGNASFESIRKNGQLYVDKTRQIFRMADEGMYYFMSRPRRFGKSLTVSTLRSLFQGRKELFEGLWVSRNSAWEWKPHPVILLDFNQISHDTPENLKSGLRRAMHRIARRHDLVSDAPLIKDQFAELILDLSEKAEMEAVILIDEYDKPMIDHLGKGEKGLETARANREILKDFLGVIKGGDISPVLRFVFITGVSKFSRVSIFSELNNLSDITMSRNYADMMGYTQEEMDTCFSDYIQRFAQKNGQPPAQIKESLKKHYDGYRFSEADVRVYNPFSVLRALDEKAFKNFWFETGTPTFLVRLLHEKEWYLPEIEKIKAGEGVFSTYDLDYLRPEALLFQTGYVTIRTVADRLYSFGYPNREVKTSFAEMLFHSCTEGMRDSSRFLLLSKYLQTEVYESFFETVTAIFASIPYTLETKRDEAYFHTVFYLMLCASGLNARSEVLMSSGRIDLLMEFSDNIFLIEFKCNQSAEAGIRQIRKKGYDEAYRQNGKKLILMGINFDTEKRNVTDWKTV